LRRGCWEESDAFLIFWTYTKADSARSPVTPKACARESLIAAALLADPEVIILDEPFSGLDVNAALLFRRLLIELAASGRMILFSSHVLEVVEKLCSQVVIFIAARWWRRIRSQAARLMSLPSLVEVFAQLTTNRIRRRARERLFR